MTALQDRQREYCGYLRSGFSGQINLPGWSLKGSAAVTGNATQENMVKPVTVGAKDHGSDGILQWRLERLTDMESWCTKNFGTWQTIQAQAAYTLHETARDYKELDAELRDGAKSIATMATNFNRVFERSADNAAINDKRIKYANDVMLLMGASPAPKPPPVVPAGVGGAGLGAVLVATLSYLGNLNAATIGIGIAIGIAGTLLAEWAYHQYQPAPAEPDIPEPEEVPPPALPAPAPVTPIDPMISELQRRAKLVADAKSAYEEERQIITKAVSDLQKSIETLQAAAKE